MNLLDEFPFPVWRAALDGKCDYFNQAWLDFTGRTVKQELGDGWVSGVHPEDLYGCLKDYYNAFQARVPFQLQYRLRRYDGEFCWVIDYGSPLNDDAGNFAGYIGACYDITERLKSARANADLAAIVESSDDAIISKTLDGTIVSWNPGAEKIYGYSAAEAIGRSIKILAPPEHHEEIDSILDSIKRDEPIGHFETTRLRKDGRQIPISLTISPIKNGQGEIIGASTIARDVSERIRTEQAMRESEERFRELAENIHEVFWLRDPQNTQIIYVSPAYEKVWGRSRESLYGTPKSWMDAIHPEDKERVAARMAKRSSKPHDMTYRIVRPDGSIHWVRDRGFPVRDASGGVVRFAGIAEDITESKQAEDALAIANRQLRILSRRRIRVEEDERRNFARELHDQIGQALTATKICIESAKLSRKREAKKSQLDEAMAIVDRMLLQVRQMTLHLRPSALDDLGLEAALRLVLSDYAKRGTWDVQFVGDGTPGRLGTEVETACFRIALEALTNILRHAKARKVSVELHKRGDSVSLIVRDDGIGFDVAGAEKRIKQDRLGLIGIGTRAGHGSCGR